MHYLFVCIWMIVENRIHFGSRSHIRTENINNYNVIYMYVRMEIVTHTFLQKSVSFFYLCHKICYLLPQLIRPYKICRYVCLVELVCVCVFAYLVWSKFYRKTSHCCLRAKKMQINMQRATSNNNNENKSKMWNWLLSENFIICLCNCNSITN